MYEKMVTEHGYSIRKLAQKLGKDKGYLENRLRLADAPEEIRALVSVRKDTLSHAYELLKVQDPKKRKRLAAQVASGQLSLVKLRERIEGRPRRSVDPTTEPEQVAAWPDRDEDGLPAAGGGPHRRRRAPQSRRRSSRRPSGSSWRSSAARSSPATRTRPTARTSRST